MRPANCHCNTGLSGRIRVRRLISHKPDRHTNTHSETHTHIICHLISAVQQGLSQGGGVMEGLGGGELKKENGKQDDEGREVIREEKQKERGRKGKSTVMTTFPCGDKK